MKALSYQVCQRYQMNPFGTSQTRFEYQKQGSPAKNDMTVDMNNGMISVKDKEVMEKRYAFQKTIELHKKMQEMRPNAIFLSKIERENVKVKGNEGVRSKYSSSVEVRDTQY